MAEYNGHPSYAAWSVAQWLSCSEPHYRRAMELLKRHEPKRAAEIMWLECPERTADHVDISRRSLAYAIECLRD